MVIQMSRIDYSSRDIVQALLKVGLEKGDSVFTHSNLGFFGKLDHGNDKDDYCNVFKEAFFEVIISNKPSEIIDVALKETNDEVPNLGFSLSNKNTENARCNKPFGVFLRSAFAEK